ncbi:hypothetical protein ZWY2020_011470 [Hordeum vulgare]|nr:hypothetical protein ZWY2020_011470 [Hordeum vulgare]
MASRLLLRFRSLGRPPPCPAHPHLAGGLHHRSPPGVLHHLLHVVLPPRVAANSSRWFGGGSHAHSSPSKSKPLRRLIVGKVLSVASFSAAGLLTSNKSEQESSPTGPNDHGSDKGKRKCTDALLAVNFLVHVADVTSNRTLNMLGAKENKLISRGQIWRLLTSSVLHADFNHLANNCTALHRIGPRLEEATGPRRFLAIYCTSALSGSLMSYWFCPNPSVGASDAILGLVGAEAVYVWRHRKHLEKANETLAEIAFVVFCNLFIALILKHRTRTDDWAHLGGFLGGAAVEWFAGPHWKKHVGPDGKEVFQLRR